MHRQSKPINIVKHNSRREFNGSLCIRISPFKVRRVLGIIKRKRGNEAKEILKFTPGSSAKRLLKTLDSAMANFKQKNTSVKDEDIFVSKKSSVDEGPTMKRIISRSQGRAEQILKRSSHIKIVVTNE